MATKMIQPEMKFVEKGHPNSQKVAVLNKAFDISLRYAEIPEPNDDEIRVKIEYVGICGSDLETFRGTRKPEFVAFPTRLGHEVAGVIDKVGKNVNGIRVGDKVTCRYVWGAYAEYIVVKPFNVKVLPHWFPLKEISLIEVLPGVIHAAEIAQIDTGRNVLIMGQGVSGLVLTQVAKLYSPKNLVVTDLHSKNLELAKKYGATHTYQIPTPQTPTLEVAGNDFPYGFDIVIPCLLEGDGMIDALNSVAFGGRIVMYGCIGTCNQPFDFFKLHRKRADIFSTEPKRDIDMRRFYQESMQMVLDGVVNTSEMITHVFPLDQIDKAFELRNDKSRSDVIHVLIDCKNEPSKIV